MKFWQRSSGLGSILSKKPAKNPLCRLPKTDDIIAFQFIWNYPYLSGVLCLGNAMNTLKWFDTVLCALCIFSPLGLYFIIRVTLMGILSRGKKI
jgi:hypothetical protein